MPATEPTVAVSPTTRSAKAAAARECETANPATSPKESRVAPKPAQSPAASVPVTPKSKQNPSPSGQATPGPRASKTEVTSELPAQSSETKSKKPRRSNLPVPTPTKGKTNAARVSGTTVAAAGSSKGTTLASPPAPPVSTPKRSRPISEVDLSKEEEDGASTRKRRKETLRKMQEQAAQRRDPSPTPVKRKPVKPVKPNGDSVGGSGSGSGSRPSPANEYRFYPYIPAGPSLDYPETMDCEEEREEEAREARLVAAGGYQFVDDDGDDYYEENVDDGKDEEDEEEYDQYEACGGYEDYEDYDDFGSMYLSPSVHRRRHYDLGPNLATVPFKPLPPPMTYPRPATPPAPGVFFYHPHFPERKPLKCLKCKSYSLGFEVKTSRTIHNPERYFFACLKCHEFVCWADAERISSTNPPCKCPEAYPSREELAREESAFARTIFYKCVTGACKLWNWSDRQLSKRQVNQRYGQLLYPDAA
ncbi:hypothetical protein Daesc_001047 [Daldinia eschscholtzii]|uniref:Uncharacterized protein n=1 Tax=Daldinia eschscholtzii TaxID=292717 RepID=A0AAX6N012_9PEZI